MRFSAAARPARRPEPAGAGAHPEARLRFAAEPYAVRAALEGVMGLLGPRNLSEDARGRVEIVLAEVLNNICEHAVVRDHGQVEIRIRSEPDHLAFLVIDDGEPMPGRRLPCPPMDPESFVDLLPEGGYGWFLIRSQSEGLAYRRDRGRNRLSFRLRIAED